MRSPSKTPKKKRTLKDAEIKHFFFFLSAGLDEPTHTLCDWEGWIDLAYSIMHTFRHYISLLLSYSSSFFNASTESTYTSIIARGMVSMALDHTATTSITPYL